MFKSLRNNEETSRVGKKWLQEEDEELMREISDKKTFEEIALNHKRTIGGIKSRVICLILYLQYKDGTKTIEELSSEYNIENDLVIKYIDKMEIRDSRQTNTLQYIDKMEINNNKKDYEIKTKVNIELLYDKIISLETKILTIEEKLDSIITIISTQKT
jgi:hypothetical protein